MNESRPYVYILLLTLAGVLVLMGAYVVSGRATVNPSNQGGTWGSGVIVNSNLPPITQVTAQSEIPPAGVNYSYTPRPQQPATQTGPTDPNQNSFDWDAFQKSLAITPTNKTNPSSPSAISEAYSFIPSGLVSISQRPEPKSDDERSLHEYGNAIGVLIQAYESEHPDQASILTNHAQDRINPQKQQALKQLGTDLIGVAEGISTTPSPASMGTAPANLSHAYRDIGEKLSLIPDARSDEDFLKAIVIYNAAADNFVSKYVAVALQFQAHAVTFGQDESGSVFMFPAN